jgi:hypothetical protein
MLSKWHLMRFNTKSNSNKKYQHFSIFYKANAFPTGLKMPAKNSVARPVT